jgi:DNA-directed RNA polymerase specialized sigma24 family protein
MNTLINTYRDTAEKAMISVIYQTDNELFSKIYDDYSPLLFGLLMKWVKEKEIAETLLCQAFTKAWHSRKLFNAENESFYCWLCRLAWICYNENSIPELKTVGFNHLK